MDLLRWRAAARRRFRFSAVAQFLGGSRSRLSAALAVTIAIPLAVLFYFQFRSVSDLGESSTLVLRQLSKQATDSIASSIERALRAPRATVGPRLQPATTQPLHVPIIERSFADTLAKYPIVNRLYVWSDVETVHRDELLAYDREHSGLYVAAPDKEQVLRGIREIARRKQTLNALTFDLNGRRTYLDATIRYREPDRERITSFVAFAVDAEYLRREYLPRLLSSLVGTWQPPAGFPPLAVTLLDDRDQVIFPMGGSTPTQYIDERELPLLFLNRELLGAAAFGAPPEMWRLRTSYGGQTIEAIVAARARLQWAMMALLAVMMAVGVLFLARAAARELRLAELKSDFVLSVSHDLKTPLALIQLFAETLELGRVKTSGRAHEYCAIINSEARKLTRLINNILDFSRIEAGLRHYRPQPLDLASVTTQVLESLAGQLQQNRFTVRTHFAPDVPPVRCDPEGASQAIENLLSNAMKYSPEHRDVFVEVDAFDCYGRVRVTDRGMGIPSRLHRKIFRKFFRAEGDAGSGPQGCGLGLAIVDHVMRAHGGFARVDSEPGHGSTFTLYFPIYQGASKGDQADSGDRRRAADVARTA